MDNLLSKYKELKEKNILTNYNLAIICAELKKFELTVKYLKLANAEEKLDQCQLFGIPNFSDGTQDLEWEYKNIIKAAPDYLYAYFDLGLIYMDKNRWTKAEEIFLDCIQKNFLIALSYYYLGFIKFKQGHYEESLRLLEIAIQKGLDKEEYKAHYLLSQVYKREKDYSHSKKELQAACSLNHDLAKKVTRIQILYMDWKGKRLSELGEKLKKVPNNEGIILELAQLYFDNCKWDKALKILQKIKKPEDKNKYYSLLRSCQELTEPSSI